MLRVHAVAALALLVVLGLAVSAEAGECTATDLAKIVPCQTKQTVPADLDAKKWCTYLQAYIECIPSKDCCAHPATKAAMDALTTANKAKLAGSCDLDCGEHGGHGHGAGATLASGTFAALAAAVAAVAMMAAH